MLPQKTRALVPAAQESSAFAQHRQSVAPLATLLGSFGSLVTTISLSALGAAVLGVPGLFIGATLGASSGMMLLNWTSLLGNPRLEESLRARLGARASSNFVGIREAVSPGTRDFVRMETDDNVGFLELTESALNVVTEEGPLTLPRDEIRGFSMEPVIELPYVKWIRVEFEQGGGVSCLLLMSRRARTLREVRKQTQQLYERLVNWHTASQLRWLEVRRSGL